MKMSKADMNHKAKKVSDDLLCCAGLKNAKKIAILVKKNLLAEQRRRKAL